MRLRNLVAQAEAPRGELVPPSPAHEQFVFLIGQVVDMMGSTHPAAKIVRRLLPSMMRDLVELPEVTLRRACRDLAIGFQAVALAGGPLPATIDEDGADLELAGPGPVEFALPAGEGS